MADRILTLRELNRATLARQMLLERARVPIPAAVERLVGLQAQLSSAPFVGLWTRLEGFERKDLAGLIDNRTIVKATLMRATLHLFTAEDYLRFRTTIQAALDGAASAITKQRGPGFDVEKVLKASSRFIGEKPRTFAEISDMLTSLMPDHEVGPMRYTVRTRIPLVQVPITSGWSYPSKPEFTLAETWIGRPISPKDRLGDLVLRYLAGFGPASVTDAQTWLGLKLKDTFEKLKPKLKVYKDQGRRELFDLADVELTPEDTPAPVRFLPEFDNLLLSHSNRRRVVADEHRTKVYLPGLRVAATFLVDGFVRGAWKVEKGKDAAALVLDPFDKLTRRDRADLIEEGEGLVRLVEPAAKSFEVRLAAGS